MTFEGPSGSEFTELVTDHVLVHQNGNMLTTVMYGNGQTNHLRHDHGTARPGLDRTTIITGSRDIDLLQQVMINKRTLLK